MSKEDRAIAELCMYTDKQWFNHQLGLYWCIRDEFGREDAAKAFPECEKYEIEQESDYADKEQDCDTPYREEEDKMYDTNLAKDEKPTMEERLDIKYPDDGYLSDAEIIYKERLDLEYPSEPLDDEIPF